MICLGQIDAPDDKHDADNNMNNFEEPIQVPQRCLADSLPLYNGSFLPSGLFGRVFSVAYLTGPSALSVDGRWRLSLLSEECSIGSDQSREEYQSMDTGTVWLGRKSVRHRRCQSGDGNDHPVYVSGTDEKDTNPSLRARLLRARNEQKLKRGKCQGNREEKPAEVTVIRCRSWAVCECLYDPSVRESWSNVSIT